MRVRLLAVAVISLVASAFAVQLVVPRDDASTTGPVPDAATPVATTPAAMVFHRLDVDAVPSPDCVADLGCLRQYYQNLTLQEGPDRAIVLLEEHGARSAELYAKCHDTTHAIGEMAGKLEQMAAAMERGDERCGSGYYHGVIATFLTTTDPADAVSALAAACAGGDDQFRRWECYHGVGHSFVFNVGGDIVRAIESCGTIEDDDARGACASGAFMQELVDNGSDPARYGEDPYAACRSVTDAVMRGQCHDMHAVIVMQHRSTDAARFEVCSSTPPGNEIDCYAGLGRALFSGMPLEAARTVEFCSTTGIDEAFDWCFDGVVSNTAAYYGSGSEAVSHCAEFEMPEHRAQCRSVLEERWELEPVAATTPAAP